MSARTDLLEHGKASTYNRRGCRCDDCRTAASDYRRAGRAKHAPQRQRDRLVSAARNEATRALEVMHAAEFVRLLAASRQARGLSTSDPEAALLDLLLIESTPPLSKMEGEVSLMRVDAATPDPMTEQEEER